MCEVIVKSSSICCGFASGTSGREFKMSGSSVRTEIKYLFRMFAFSVSSVTFLPWSTVDEDLLKCLV